MQVRIIAEVYPLEVCESIDTCQLDGESGHFDIKAQGRAPFDTWGVDKPQLRECFVDCKLPQPGLKLAMAHLRYMSSLAADGLKVAELAASADRQSMRATMWAPYLGQRAVQLVQGC